jgi:GAF domain-containing protein
MKDQHRLTALMTAAVGDADRDQSRLLQSMVEVARAIFGAKASSVFLVDETTSELVFEAVAGEGEGTLIGRRFPATKGIAGWVLASGEAVAVSEVSSNPAFARDVAESTGYVPTALMAAPLVDHGEGIGVLEVLDYGICAGSTLSSMELLALFAGQATVALSVLRRIRAAQRVLAEDTGDLSVLVSVARTLDGLSEDRRTAGLRLLGTFHDLLGQPL